jgi:tetratricopeptide (TPR) repeat protein
VSDEIRALTARLADEPTSLAFLELGEALRRRGQYDAAAKVARGGLSRYPGLADAHDLVARILSDQGDLAGAFDAWADAIRLDPMRSSALKGLAFLYFRAGEVPAALEHLARAAEADPDDVTIPAAIARIEQEVRETSAPPPPPQEPAPVPAPPADAPAASPAQSRAVSASTAPATPPSSPTVDSPFADFSSFSQTRTDSGWAARSPHPAAARRAIAWPRSSAEWCGRRDAPPGSWASGAGTRSPSRPRPPSWSWCRRAATRCCSRRGSHPCRWLASDCSRSGPPG